MFMYRIYLRLYREVSRICSCIEYIKGCTERYLGYVHVQNTFKVVQKGV